MYELFSCVFFVYVIAVKIEGAFYKEFHAVKDIRCLELAKYEYHAPFLHFEGGCWYIIVIFKGPAAEIMINFMTGRKSTKYLDQLHLEYTQKIRERPLLLVKNLCWQRYQSRLQIASTTRDNQFNGTSISIYGYISDLPQNFGKLAMEATQQDYMD